jgi:hypothetical protein
VLVRGDGGDSYGASVGEKGDCHGMAEKFRHVRMGTGSFEVALDISMLKDAIVDNCCPVQNTLATQATLATQVDGVKTMILIRLSASLGLTL